VQSDAQTLESEIIGDARKRAERVAARARREADSVLAQARREAGDLLARARARAELQAERERHRVEARTRQDLENARLEAVGAVLDHIRESALAELAELARGDTYGSVLTTLALRAIASMEGHAFELELRPEDMEAWGRRLPEDIASAVSQHLGRYVRTELREPGLGCRGGLIIRGARGRQVADQTFEARILRLWDQLCEQIVRLLPLAREGNP
jgi:vacuolar-type H+-ATPase subunit E/Vma4